MNAPRQVLLFQTDYLSPRLLQELESIRAATGPYDAIADAAMALYHDRGDPDSARRLSGVPHHRVTDDDLNALPYPRIGPRLIPGHAHFPLLHLFGQNPAFDYYWVIENDVRYTGLWQDFLRWFQGNDADFLTTFIHHHAAMPGWTWWNLEHPTEAIPLAERIRCFAPIYRISRRALQLLHEKQTSGWRGHFETLAPTLLYREGLRIEEIGGNGPFVPPERAGRFYTQDPPCAFGSLNGGTFRHRPAFIRPGRQPNMLYHPIKERGLRNLAEGVLSQLFPWPATRIARYLVRRQLQG